MSSFENFLKSPAVKHGFSLFVEWIVGIVFHYLLSG